MSMGDKLTGRVKQAAGDLLDDAGLRKEGRDEEAKGQAKDEAARHEEAAAQKEREAAALDDKP